MGPCLRTVGRSGGNSRSVVLINCDDARLLAISEEQACLLQLQLPLLAWERKIVYLFIQLQRKLNYIFKNTLSVNCSTNCSDLGHHLLGLLQYQQLWNHNQLAMRSETSWPVLAKEAWPAYVSWPLALRCTPIFFFPPCWEPGPDQGVGGLMGGMVTAENGENGKFLSA